MKIVLDVPETHEGKDMFDFIGELCDANDIPATMTILPEPPKIKPPPTYLDFSVVFRGTVGIGVAEEGGWVLDKNSLDSNLGAMIQRTLDNGGVTTDSDSELLTHSFSVNVTPR